MIAVLRSLRKLVLGETWVLPIGIGVAVGLSALLSEILSEEVWSAAGGFVLLGLVVAALGVSLRRG